MINAGIFNGDQIIVAQQDTAENGDIIVALMDDSATVKRFYREDDHVRLQPEMTRWSLLLPQMYRFSAKSSGWFG